MARRQSEEDEALDIIPGILENLQTDIARFCEAWRPAISPRETDCEDFTFARLREELGLYRYPEGLDVFSEARRQLEAAGFAFRSFAGVPTLFVVPKHKGLRLNAETAVEVES